VSAPPKLLRRVAFVGLTVTSLAGAAPQSNPDATARAAVLFERALHEYDRREYAGAAADLRAAYELAPRYTVLYNLGLADAGAGHPTAAIESFQAYLSQGGAEIAESRRDAVLALIAQLSKRVGTLQIDVTPGDALVEVDGAPLTAGASTRLDAGEHSVRASADGFEPYTTSLLVGPDASSYHLVVQLHPVPEVPPPAPTGDAVPMAGGAPPQQPILTTPPAPVPKTPALSNTDVVLWSAILAGTGAALGIAAGVIAMVDGNRYDDWKARDAEIRRLPPGPATERAAESNAALGRSIEHLDGVALGLAAGGGCLLVAGGVLWVTAPSAPHGRGTSIGWTTTW
jgi:hypothetical protein